MHLRAAGFILTMLLATGLRAIAAEPAVREIPGKFGDSKLLATASGLRLFATGGGELLTKRFLADEPLLPLTHSIPASWLAVAEAPGRQHTLAMVASFADRRARLYRIDGNRQAELIAVLAGADETLRIDPTLLAWERGYFATWTEIEGTVNNAFPTKGGRYTVRLYVSPDLIHWTRRAVVISAQANLEDGSLFLDAKSGFLYYLCEYEGYDKGPSSLVLCRSEDEGRTWSEPITLVDDGADNEPAAAWVAGSEVRVLFSSDRRSPGKSYDGGDAYYLRLRLADYRKIAETRLEEAGSKLLLLNGSISGESASLVGIRSFSRDPALAEMRVGLSPSP